MLEHEAYTNVKEFRNGFDKKFSNFCKKAPIFLSYIAGDNSVSIYQHPNSKDRTIREKIIEYEFNFNMSVKENIFEIRRQLIENWYPMLRKRITYEESHDAQELNVMVEKGEITIDDIGTNGILKEKETLLRIERVIVMKDWLFVRNLDTNEMCQYRTRMPVTTFLRRIQELDDNKSIDLFNKKAIFNKIVEEDEGTRKLLLLGEKVNETI